MVKSSTDMQFEKANTGTTLTMMNNVILYILYTLNDTTKYVTKNSPPDLRNQVLPSLKLRSHHYITVVTAMYSTIHNQTHPDVYYLLDLKFVLYVIM